jgi:hypothetical protein
VNQPPQALTDPGNDMLAPGPARLNCGTVTTPDGKLGVLTIRTSSATVTVLLDAKALRDWAGLIVSVAGQLSEQLVQATVSDVAALDGLLRPSPDRRGRA